MAKKKKEKWYEDLGEGIWSSMLGTGYGIHDLFKELSPEQKANLKDWQDDAAESGWGTAGNVVGEIAQMAAPGGALLKIGRGLSKANKVRRGVETLGDIKQMGKVGRAGLDASAAAMFEGAQYDPDQERAATIGERLMDRGGAAAKGAGMSLGGSAGGELLSRTGKGLIGGISKSEAAKKYMSDYGAMLTPGQATDNKLVKWIEDAMHIAPGTGRAITELREESQAQWQDIAQRASALDPSKLTADGTKGWKEIMKQLEDKFEEAYEGPSTMSLEDMKKLSSDLAKISKDSLRGQYKTLDDLRYNVNKHGTRVSSDLNDKQIDKIEELMAKSVPEESALKYVMDPSYGLADIEQGNVRLVDSAFKEANEALNASNPKAPKHMRERVKSAQEDFRGSMDPNNVNALESAEENWQRVETMKKARARANSMDGSSDRVPGISPTSILQTGAEVVGDEAASLNKTPLQEIADLGKMTVGQKAIGQPMQFMRRALHEGQVGEVAPGIIPKKQLGNFGQFMLGQTDTQKDLQRRIAANADTRIQKGAGMLRSVAKDAGARGSMVPQAMVVKGEGDKRVEESRRKDADAADYIQKMRGPSRTNSKQLSPEEQEYMRMRKAQM